MTARTPARLAAGGLRADTELTVAFDGARVKKLLLSLAPLERG